MKPTELDSMNRLRVEAAERAKRAEYALRLLVAAGHVTQAKVDEAFKLYDTFCLEDAPPSAAKEIPHA